MIKLTDREDEVMRLVCTGAGNKAIALRLGISIDTVRNQLHRALAKLGASNRTAGAIIYVAKVNPQHLYECQ